MKSQNSAIGLSLLTAFASSLCCIVPFIALLAGTSSLAANFSWIEPAQPYLYGLSILALGFAWYQHLKPVAADDCGCEVGSTSFFKGKNFLGIITVFAIAMMTFPYYSGNLFANSPSMLISDVEEENIVSVEIEVEGMTCSGCEAHIENAVGELQGIVEVKATYENEKTIVKFDGSQTTVDEIKEAIKKTNYKVKRSKIVY